MDQEKHSDNNIKTILLKGLCTITIGFFTAFLLLIITMEFYQIWYAGRIFPGVTVAHIDIGNLPTEKAELMLENSLASYADKPLQIKWGEMQWQANYSELGIQIDIRKSVDMAYQFGRRGGFLQWLAELTSVWFGNPHSNLVVLLNEQSSVGFLSKIADQINQPVIEAGIAINGTQVVASPGQIGQELDIQESLELIMQHIEEYQIEPIDLPVRLQIPDVLNAASYAAFAQDYLRQPLVLYFIEEESSEQRSWVIRPENLAPMIVFQKNTSSGNTQIITTINESIFSSFLEKVSAAVNRNPENPRFIFNDETRKLDLLHAGIRGRTLDVEATIDFIKTGIHEGEHEFELVIQYEPPSISDSMTASELGITELILEESSFFYGSSRARVQNIQTAAARFHGLLVAPGEAFSMAQAMGEISLDTGFTEALIIFNGKTIEGVGGGVCQVSTTLFRTAFFSGFPIVERYPHAYRVSYYEKVAGNYRDSNLAGLDATVYVPLVDLKFINDTPFWLLMETYVIPEASRITWKFYSTSDGRWVDWQTTGPINTEEPKKPLYKMNPDLTSGEIKQVDWEAEGADVRVHRWVYKNEQFYFEDAFFTHYEPWRAVYEYGPGTDGIPISEEE